MIKAISFDVGRVCENFDKMIACRKIAARTSLTPEDVNVRLTNSPLERNLELGRISSREFAQRVIERFEIRNTTPSEVIRMWGDIMSPNPDIIPIVKVLLKKPLRFNVLSNTSPIHWPYIMRLAPLPQLRRARATFTVSYLVGAAKPEQMIYETMMSSLDMPPSEILVLDDVDSYCGVARTFGFNAEQYDCTKNNAVYLRRIFEKYNVL